ncbi:unnamed protein product, partial [Penicillium nalgiovense]
IADLSPLIPQSHHISPTKLAPSNPSSTHSSSLHSPSFPKTPSTLSCPLSTKAYCQISHTPSPNSKTPDQQHLSPPHTTPWPLSKPSSRKQQISHIHFAA